ncbi:MAG: cyclic pyranopterin monophosphate synthase MoaC, partial [Sulfurovaceae bacterium]
MDLTHLDENKKPKMVDVGDKPNTQRIATASGTITMSQAAYDAVKNDDTKKGPVLQTAVIAAVMGAKKTSDLIPMCHPLLLTSIKTEMEDMPELPGFKLIVTAKLNGQTGVE